jgi:hypothetical protein
MRIIATSILISLQVVLMVFFNPLIFIYTIDLILSGWLILVFFLSPIMFAFAWWGVIVALAPVALAAGDDASDRQRALGLTLVPLGLFAAFLLWQAENWFIYGLLDSDPRFYNWVFDRIGFGI